jgi:IS30 family transposase
LAAYRHLGSDDRIQIQVLTKRGVSDAEIARELKVHRSTVGRERRRNKVDGMYYYHQAQACAERRQRERRRRAAKLTPAVVAFVEEKLRVGDWELDTIVGSQRKGALVSMVERGSKLVRLALVAESKSEPVASAIERSLAKDIDKVLTLTMDNGAEFARHKLFGAALDADTFFARPYHAWERGLNEHTNGLVRQYFPKSTDFNTISQDEVHRVEELLNNRPRAVLTFRTPLEVFSNPQLLQPVALAT